MTHSQDIDSILHQTPEKVREIQNIRLRKMMSLCKEGHSFYRELYQKHGIEFDDIHSIEDLEALPLTEKTDFMSHPQEFVLQCPDLPMFERIIYNQLYTTGTTTGQPTPFYNTAHDYYAVLAISKRIAEIVGITAQDTIINTYPLTQIPHLTSFAAFCYATVTGARLVSTLTGTPYPEFPITRATNEAATMIQDSRATIIWGFPSFVRRILGLAEEMNLRYTSVRCAGVSGEPCSEGLREDILKRLTRLGASNPTVNNRFGFTEMSTVFVECDPHGRGGFHNAAPDYFFIEVVDIETGKRLSDGQVGYLAITHLNRRGTVLLRYLTGDMVALSHEPCPCCGRTTVRVVTQPVRKSELVKFKGTLINPKPLQEALSGLSEVEEFQILFTKLDPEDPLSQDHLQIRIATSEDHDRVRDQIISLTLQAIEMRPEVVFVHRDAIYNPDEVFKSKRILIQNQ
jgi:phenylacetate-coenzyme A ligase PaaK-like adenylate-forming protein